MRTKPLGGAGEQVAEIGLGTWKYGGDPAVVHRALEVGANLIDTAEMYDTERQVGAAIAGNRSAYFVATKVSPDHLRAKEVVNAADRSLRRLGIEVIDLYQVHWPNERIPIDETMDGMARLLRDGKVRYVGVSNFSVEEMRDADEALRDLSSGHRVVANQVRYSVFDRSIEEDLLPYCEENGVTIIGYSPLAQGMLAQELADNAALNDALERIARELDKTLAQVLLNWAVRSPWAITIPATNRLHRVVENAEASDWSLTEAHLAAIDAARG